MGNDANFGDFYRQTNENAKALDYYRQALQIFNECLGPDSPKTTKAMEAIAKVSV